MLFQALDNKRDCFGIYYDGKILKDFFPEDATHTWSYTPHVPLCSLECAQLYSGGLTLSEACPESLRRRYEYVERRLKAHFRAFQVAKVSLDENCFFDLIPEQFLKDYSEIKNQISQHIFNTHERPENYDFLLQLASVLNEIRYQKLNLDFSALRSELLDPKMKNRVLKLQNVQPYCNYDMFKTKTGRLTTKRNSFPILTLPKQHRKVLKPNNDWFISFDFNAAELRTALALLEQPQPEGDLHEWARKEAFDMRLSRSEVKEKTFSWLYGAERGSINLPNLDVEEILERTYQKRRIKEIYWSNSLVTTPFARSIPSDSHHALSYLIQSSCSDLTFEQVFSINRTLSSCRSRIAFIIHDEVVLDFADEDRGKLLELVENFSNTRFGKYKVGVKAGKSFGSMKELNIKI